MILALLLLTVNIVLAQPVDYRIVSGGENTIGLEVEKTGLMRGKKHNFLFPKFQGKLRYDSQTLTNSSADLTIDSASIICQDTWLSPGDLKKVLDYALQDMLNVKKFPELRFTSTRVTPQTSGKFLVEGTLTIRGITRPATLDVTLKPEGPLVEGNSIIKLTSFGLKPPTAALGTIGTKDGMTATFHIQAVK